MRLRYSILLDKAKAMLDHTLTMAERTGEQSPWVLKSRQARDAIAQAMEEERQALARLPYTKAQLQAALDAFSTGQASPPPPKAPPPAKEHLVAPRNRGQCPFDQPCF